MTKTSRRCPACRLRSYFNSYTTITDRTPELLSRLDSLERVTFDNCHRLTNAGSRISRACHGCRICA